MVFSQASARLPGLYGGMRQVVFGSEQYLALDSPIASGEATPTSSGGETRRLLLAAEEAADATP